MGRELNTEKFIKKAIAKFGQKYNYGKTNYINSRTKVTILCPEHGEFLQTPDHHLCSKTGCPKCSNKKRSNRLCCSTGKFIELAKIVHNNFYDYSKVVFKNSLTKVLIICLKHGEFWQLPTNHLKGCGCYKCGRNKTINAQVLRKEEFIRRAKEKHGDKYNYDKAIYVKQYEAIIITCLRHGDFKQIPKNHMKGNGCPICRESKGEKQIRKYLINHNINFKPQHKFKSCKNKDFLPFDFVIWHNKKIKIIEYNGKQHYVPMGFGGEDKFKKLERTIVSDKIKLDWCKKKRMPFLVIPYYSYKDIDEILDNFLN
jgi:hypothetical protein